MACGAPAPVESTVTVPSGQSRERVHQAAVELALEQLVGLLELLVRRLVDRLHADLAVDPRVDLAVRLAVAPRDQRHQVVALRAQALAPLERRLRLGRRHLHHRRERGQGGRDLRLGLREQLQRLAGLGGLQHLVVALGARPQRAERLLRLRALAPLGVLAAHGLEDQRVLALLLDRDRQPLQPRIRRQEDVRHLLLGLRRAADEAPDHLAEEQLGARVVAYTPTRRRGTSTPSDTISTDTSHGSDAGAEARDPRRRVRPRRSARRPAARP